MLICGKNIKNKAQNLTFFGWVFFFNIPFLFPIYYAQLVYLQFLIFTPAILIFFFTQSLSYFFNTAFLSYAFILFAFGSKGSVLGYASSAVFGLIFANYISHQKDTEFFKIPFYLLFLGQFLSLIFLILTADKSSFSEYFGVASINYASLTISGFSILFLVTTLWFNFSSGKRLTEFPKAYNWILFFLVLQCLIAVLLFGTRSTFLTLISLALIFALTFKYWKEIYIVSSLLVAAFLVPFSDNFLRNFIYGGAGSFLTFFEAEIGKKSERYSRAVEVLEKINLDITLFAPREATSFSGIVNFFAYLFPFSVFYLVFVFSCFAISLYFLVFAPSARSFYACLTILFISSFSQTLFHPDFYSVMILFFVSGVSYFSAMQKSTVFDAK